MIINFIATAGIAILVIFIYYLAEYEPARDALAKTGNFEITSPFRPNPVDVVFLRVVHYIPRQIFGANLMDMHNRARLQSKFIKVGESCSQSESCLIENIVLSCDE